MTRRLRKRSPIREHQDDGVLGYFFHVDEQGRPKRPRKDLVQRDELWAALDWYHRRVAVENRWYRRLWRALKQSQVVRFDPFRFVELVRRRKEVGEGVPVQDRAP